MFVFIDRYLLFFCLVLNLRIKRESVFIYSFIKKKSEYLLDARYFDELWKKDDRHCFCLNKAHNAVKKVT